MHLSPPCWETNIFIFLRIVHAKGSDTSVSHFTPPTKQFGKQFGKLNPHLKGHTFHEEWGKNVDRVCL
jgi:hypothetical protein